MPVGGYTILTTKMGKKNTKETPLMRQYNAIKRKHPGALLLFRVGDFYETFGQDAVLASKILEITLTKRANGAASEVELAGFPHHALDRYLPILVRAGQRVAICDQVEDPKAAKGIVKRALTEVVTPGLSMNDNVLEVSRNNYLSSVFFSKKKLVGAAFLDISTGEFLLSEGRVSYIDKLLRSFRPAEVLFAKPQSDECAIFFQDDNYSQFRLDEWVYAYDYAYEKLTQHFGTNNLKGFGIEKQTAGIVAAGAILYYLEITEHLHTGHIRRIARIEEEEYVWLDRFTIRNLELLQPQHEGGVPLLQILDHCLTPMGARCMKKWVVLPLKNPAQIRERQASVAHLAQPENEALAAKLTDLLRQIGDLERLISKVAVGRINPREMVQLGKALAACLPIKQMLKKIPNPPLQRLSEKLTPCDFLIRKIETELIEKPPLHSNLGGLFRTHINPELDKLRDLAYSGKDYLLKIQQDEAARTGISSLKIGYNKVFGYYLEVKNTHKDKVPPEWIRKQTLVSAERYITEELKHYEEKILNAEEKMFALEQQMFQQLVVAAADFLVPVQHNAQLIATLDCLLSFATVASKHQYCRPTIGEGKQLIIKAGRHPVIEQQLPPGELYVPNDVRLDPDDAQILIITGPNMSGKSALLRQTALIVLMAQMGSFVPATEAHIGLVDKVFTRVGASDNLSQGESTFMVEMTETASILNNLSDRSLVLMDEIGRGTSTYDGISIAWAILEFLHNRKGGRAKTLFATHYHELNELAEALPYIRNFNVSVQETDKKVIFLRKLEPGSCQHSFGIHVAQMAGMPNEILIRAQEILEKLEKDKIKERRKKKIKEIPKVNYQLNLFEANDPNYQKLKEILKNLDINTISPVEALLKLNEIKQLIG